MSRSIHQVVNVHVVPERNLIQHLLQVCQVFRVVMVVPESPLLIYLQRKYLFSSELLFGSPLRYTPLRRFRSTEINMDSCCQRRSMLSSRRSANEIMSSSSDTEIKLPCLS